MNADDFYGYAINPEDGFDGIADIVLPTPLGGAFAGAKLGRWGLHTDSLPRPFADRDGRQGTLGFDRLDISGNENS